MHNIANQFFISGTDTDVGKTFIAAAFVDAFQMHYWKPIQTGCEEMMQDSLYIQDAVSRDIQIFQEKIALQKPLSPHEAASYENRHIDFQEWQLPTKDTLLVEGAGGLLVPINKEQYMIDLIAKLQLPVVLVVRSALGTLNHSLLSIEALQKRAIPLLGLIMNGDLNAGNKASLEAYGKVPVLAEIPFLQGTKQEKTKQAAAILAKQIRLVR